MLQTILYYLVEFVQQDNFKQLNTNFSTSQQQRGKLQPPNKKVASDNNGNSNPILFFSPKMFLDFFAGCVGGIAGMLVGHPFDTAKVHLQTNPIYKGTFHCMHHIYSQEGFRGLYKGMSSPLAGIGLVNSIVFGVFGIVQRSAKDPNALSSHFLSGSISGFAQSIVCSPMELAKTRIQLQPDNSTKYKGPMDCLRQIRRDEGFKGVYRGFWMTAWRDIPGFSTYFVTYETIMRVSPEPNAFLSLIAGGFAGMASWVVCYPMDVLKTAIQMDGVNEKPIYKGSYDCMMINFRKHGWTFFTRGLSTSLWRAFPMNAACFFVVSLILRFSKNSNVDLIVQPSESLAAVSVNTPMTHIHKHDSPADTQKRKRVLIAHSLRTLGTFNEAVCPTEMLEMANDFYPDNAETERGSYYLYEDDRIIEHIGLSALERGQQMEC